MSSVSIACPECGRDMQGDGDRYKCSCGHHGEQLAIKFRKERKNWMSENKEFALQLALEKIEAAEMRIAQLSHEADFARSDAKHWMKKAKHFEGFVRLECEECGRGFAVHDPDGDDLPEPACPECGSTNCKTIEAPR